MPQPFYWRTSYQNGSHIDIQIDGQTDDGYDKPLDRAHHVFGGVSVSYRILPQDGVDFYLIDNYTELKAQFDAMRNYGGHLVSSIDAIGEIGESAKAEAEQSPAQLDANCVMSSYRIIINDLQPVFQVLRNILQGTNSWGEAIWLEDVNGQRVVNDID